MAADLLVLVLLPYTKRRRKGSFVGGEPAHGLPEAMNKMLA